MKQIEKIRNYNLDLIDETFSDRIDFLIEQERYADAEAIVQEVILDEGDDPNFFDTIFLEDLTLYDDEDLSQLGFYVTD